MKRVDAESAPTYPSQSTHTGLGVSDYAVAMLLLMLFFRIYISIFARDILGVFLA